MAYIFDGIPVLKGLMGYWYHFAIMFEAVFILTAVDTGTRVGRFFLQEMIGALHPQVCRKEMGPRHHHHQRRLHAFSGAIWSIPANISTIWPLFGMSNQLLASSALIIGTTMIMRMNKVKYAWMTGVPGILMAFITMYAGYLTVVNNFLPKHLYLLTVMSIIIMVLMVIVFVGAIKKWFELLKVKTTVVDEYGEKVLEIVPE